MSDYSYFRGRPGGGAILVLDAGTSTIDFTLFGIGSNTALVRMVDGRLDQLYAHARFHAKDATGRTIADIDCADEQPPGHRSAVEFLFNWLEQRAGGVPVRAVGHRVIDGGPRFSGAARIDTPTLRYLQALVPIAPAGQRACLLTIQVIAQRWPELPQVACFETAFLHDVPALDLAPPVPKSMSKRGIPRHGYHGLRLSPSLTPWSGRRARGTRQNHRRARRCRGEFVRAQGRAQRCDGDGPRRTRWLARYAHPTARSGRRQSSCGGVADGPPPGEGPSSAALERLGVSGLAGALDRLVGSDEPRARVDVEFLLYRVSGALELLAAALSDLDAVVFTASTGPHAVPIRGGICRRAARLGVDLDPAANQAGGPRLTRPGSTVTAWVVPADKRLLVARHTLAVVG